ncbi:MAG TPA: OmpA family protein [Puia sp.]|nr:OmpA family protein [Puia sp.]
MACRAGHFLNIISCLLLIGQPGLPAADLKNITCIDDQESGDTTLIIYFPTASFHIEPAEQMKLDIFFRDHPAARLLRIAGFADTVGKSESNLELSFQRSRTVLRWIQHKYPQSGSCPTQNFGESKPASPFRNSLNRRVEILVDRAGPVSRLSDSSTSKNVLLKKLVLDQLYFQPDKAVLESQSMDYLRSIMEELKKYQHARFEIYGHVNTPPYKNKSSGFQKQMQQLSEARAKLIYESLLDHGIPAAQMSYRGMGNSQMIYPDPKNEEEKRKNMRVEILVFDNE